MSFKILTDTSSNIPTPWLKEHDITVVPFLYFVDGVENTCMDTEKFDGVDFYTKISQGVEVNTSQINPDMFTEAMTPLLKEGNDIMYVGMSSGISGAYNSSCIAAEELREAFPDRKIYVLDTRAASLGEGLCVMKAVEMRDNGMGIDEVAEAMKPIMENMYQIFTVADLMHLKRHGRITGAVAIAGTVLGIKPLMRGNEFGQIINFGKARGKKVYQAIADKYDSLVKDAGSQTIGLAHANAPEDAEYLIKLLNRNNPPKEILNVMYEPVTGAHVGPGTVALFFFGEPGCRYK